MLIFFLSMASTLTNFFLQRYYGVGCDVMFLEGFGLFMSERLTRVTYFTIVKMRYHDQGNL